MLPGAIDGPRGGSGDGVMRVLVVEDEELLAKVLGRSLTEEGYAVDLAGSGEDALKLCYAARYEAIVLDVLLPGMDGFDVCRRLRRERIETPILLLTARDAVRDRVEGLDAGADDYLVKPFAFAELSARLRALRRRSAEKVVPDVRVGDVRLDASARLVWRGDEQIDLGNKEFQILEYLLRHPNRVLTRTMIAERVWDYDFPIVTNVIDVHIRSLRRKLGDAPPGTLIQTVRGAGYRLKGAD